MAHCLGTYPMPVARLIRYVIRKNRTSTVKCILRGRRPKKGSRGWGHWGSLRLRDARWASVYVEWDAARPVNRAHRRQEARQNQRIADHIRAQARELILQQPHPPNQ